MRHPRNRREPHADELLEAYPVGPCPVQQMYADAHEDKEQRYQDGLADQAEEHHIVWTWGGEAPDPYQYI